MKVRYLSRKEWSEMKIKWKDHKIKIKTPKITGKSYCGDKFTLMPEDFIEKGKKINFEKWLDR